MILNVLPGSYVSLIAVFRHIWFSKSFFSSCEKEKNVLFPDDYEVFDVLDFEEAKILNPAKRYANQLLENYKEDYIGARMREILA